MRSKLFIPAACFLFSLVWLPEPTRGQDAGVSGSGRMEVLTRGPIHEGFATQAQANAVAGVKIDRVPPQLIEELPPDSRPVGANIQWLPGYWGWDAEAKDFLWVSGSYRNIPPGQRWLPGYWNPVEGGAQWMSGFFLKDDISKVSYRSAPPKSPERGPTSESPSTNHFWVPGVYQPAEGKYLWRPGYWSQQQENYVWNPSQNVITAGGHVFAPGYWDYRLENRGALFAPVRVASGTSVDTALRFTPSVIIPATRLQHHLFSPVNSNQYLFGNYYGEQYAQQGIHPWYATQFAPGVPDAMFGQSAWYYGRTGANYRDILSGWNRHYTDNVALRPALNLDSQLDLVKSQAGATGLANSLLAVNLSDATSAKLGSFVNLSATERASVATATQALQLLAVQRLNVEGGVGNALNVATNVGGNVNVATQTLALPAVPATLGIVGSATNGLVPGVTNGLVPGVTNGLVPGVTNGLVPGVTNGLIPGVLGTAPNLPSSGLLPNLGGGDDGGGDE